MSKTSWTLAIGFFLGLGIEAALAGGAISLSGGSTSGPSTPSSITTPFFDGGIVSVNGPAAVECVVGVDSASDFRAICLDRAAGLSAAAPYIAYNAGTAVMTIANGSNAIALSTSGTVSTDNLTASGVAGLNLSNTNGRITWTTAGRYINVSEATGTLILNSLSLASDGTINITGDEIAITNATTQAFYCKSGTGQCYLVSNMNDATVSATVPAIAIKALVNVTAGDLIAAFQDSAGTNVMTVDEQGNVFLNASATASKGTCTLDGATPAVCTATVKANSTCTCSPVGTTAVIAAAGCAVSLSSTTLTITGAAAATNDVNYHCF